MGNKVSKFKAFIEGTTTLSSSRWGIFTTLLAFSAISIAMGVWLNMNWLIYMGFGLVAVAVILATIWLKRGSRDTTATKDDINALGKKIEIALDNLSNKIGDMKESVTKSIDSLINEIRQDRENRNITKK
jgi:uncharacterized membrane protein (DUF485 family)